MLSWWKLSGHPPETLRGGLRIFWLKSLANPDKIFKKNAKKIFLAGFASDFSQNFRWDNIAGQHGRCTDFKNVIFEKNH